MFHIGICGGYADAVMPRCRDAVPGFSPKGIEVHPIDEIPVSIYGVARTLVDCFKYRNKVVLDVALEALRFARARDRVSNREILHFANLLRRDRVMAPYLESVT
jgi:hypothetical protein